MKKKLNLFSFLVLALALGLLIFNCKQQEKTPEKDSAQGAQEVAEEISAQSSNPPAIIIRQGAYLFDVPGGKLIQQLDIGTEVTYFPDDDVQSDDKYNTVYRHVRTAKADDGYVAGYYVIENATPMLVQEDAPRLTGIDPYSYSSKGDVIYRGTLVAVKKMYPTGVAQISYANMSTNYAMGTQYINSDYLTEVSDLPTYQAFITAYQMNNKDSKAALLNAIADADVGFLSSEINSLLYSLTVEAPLPPPLQVGTQILVSEDNLNVRGGPGVNNDSVGKLMQGARLKVTAVSAAVDKIGSNTDYWYEVSNLDTGEDGWVYGAFVQVDSSDTAAPATEDEAAPVAAEGEAE